MSCEFKGSSAHFTVKTSPLTSLPVDGVLEKVKQCLKKSFLLEPLTSVPLNEGLMVILGTPPSSENPTLTATLRVYAAQSMITLNLEGCGPLNRPSVDAVDAMAGVDSVGINNNSADKLKTDLSRALGFEPERIPLLKRGCEVPIYYTSSDDRIFEYDFDRLLVDEKSQYQQVKILHSPTLGNALLLDDLQNLAEADIAYTQGLMKFGKIDYKDKEILILGGGDGGLLHELLKEKPKFVTMVDIDEVVMKSCREHMRGACGSDLDNFEGDNYRVIVGDCLKYMQEYIEKKRTFDVVFNDLTDIPLSSETSKGGSDLWAFIRKIINLAFKCLEPNGRYLNHAIGAGCVAALAEYENLLNSLPMKVKFSRHSAFVPSFLEEWVFYEVWKDSQEKC